MVGATPYGYVDEEAREYVVTRPDTPTPWINYLGEGRYGGIVSNTGGGYSFDRDPRNRRVSRYRYNGVPADQPGRYVYLRDQQTGAFWSATWQPVRQEPDAYECRHGAGYTRIATEHDGIASELLYFVPPGEDAPPCELWVLRVRNLGDRPREAAQLQLRRALLSGRARRPAQPRLGAAHRRAAVARTARS